MESIGILIIDDEPVNVDIIKEILEFEKGFTYRAASSGEEALELLKDYFPDIVLLDIMMPGIDGYEVCRRIKKDPNHRFTKILMVTGKAMIDERLKGYEVGADDYVTKPFVDDELLAKIKVFSKLKKTEEVDLLKTSILQLFSHETKTPLNGILMGAQLILENPGNPDKVSEFAGLIMQSGERLNNLVKKILLLTHLRNNRKLNSYAMPLKSFLEELIETRQKENKTDIVLNLDCPEDTELCFDWPLVHTAVDSVLDNAIKFSEPEGKVDIDCQVKNGVCTFKITDYGPGIDPATKNFMFNEFYTDNIKHHTRGTALSLPIARQIMNLHHGSLEAESSPGEQTTFTFTLPCRLSG
ncbi:MAG: hybrid sensor histidine kinase/response regulator [Thermodesulfobacteriota bacterium]